MTPELLANQMRSARAWLNWSREDLAERAGVAANTIAGIEKGDGQTQPNARTMAKIMQAFEMGGILFTPKGLEKKEDVITIFEGEDWYLRLLDDVYYSLENKKGAELLFICADDRASPPIVNEKLRKIRTMGVQMRQLVEDGNSYLMGDINEYRYMPKERFKNYVSLIYGGKVAICTDNNTKALVFKDPHLAETWTNVFNVMWDVLKKPERSTADERF